MSDTPARRIRGACVLILAVLWTLRSSSATYYVDASAGNDANNGTSPALAWQTLSKVSGTTFTAGDWILFRAGESWFGELDLNGNGSAENPIAVDRYGTGNKPLINGNGFETALRLQGVSFWEISNLEITNDGGPTQSGAADYRTGVLVKSAYGVVRRHIFLRDLTIHDIYPETGPYGHGIHVIAQGSSTVDTYYDDVRIENCHISLTGRFGVWVQHTGSASSNPGYQFNKNIVIRDNLFVNTGGSGAETGWCDGVLLENNVVHNSGASVDPRQWARGSGYWPWKSRNVLVQSNEFRHARGEADSCGVHIDYGCRDVTVQYNLSLDNEGGFVEILGDCVNSVYRYNISINDGSRIKGVNGASQDGALIWVSDYNGGGAGVGSTNSQIYNNTIYVRPGITNYIKIVAKSTDTYIRNNVFQMDGRCVYTDAGNNTVFDHNLWYGNLPTGLPFESGAIFANPLLANSGGTNATDYLLSPVSPAIASGTAVNDDGGQDYWGNPLPVDNLCIGAHQRQFSDTGIISVNFTDTAAQPQQIGEGQPYGIPAQNSRASGWLNLTRTVNRAGLPFADGFPSTVTMTGSSPGGWGTCNSAYTNTPLLAGMANYIGTAKPAVVTLSNLSGTFPNGYRLIAFITGFNSNTGASVSDGTTTCYYRTLNDPANQFYGPLIQTSTTNSSGNPPFAQYAVFGEHGLLTNDTLTLSLKALSGGGVILGGFQILSAGQYTSHGVPYGWFEAYGIPVDDDADGDADNVSAWQEFVAGTDPGNGASCFKILSLERSGSDLAVTWLGGATGYQGNWSVAVSTDLVEWILLESSTIPRNSSGTNRWVHTNALGAATRGFYRVGVDFTSSLR